MSLRKYLYPKSYLRYLEKYITSYEGRLPHNHIIDKMIHPVVFSELKKLDGVQIETLNINLGEYHDWVNRFFRNWKKTFRHIEHKKLLELYSTFKLLDLRPSDVYLDAAGGRHTYINQVEVIPKPSLGV